MDPFAEKEEVFINIGDNENIPLTTLTNFIEIGNTSKMGAVITTLYYDKFTKIVYFDGYYVFEPYCAPNGLPYKYNPETNTLEEIELD